MLDKTYIYIFFSDYVSPQDNAEIRLLCSCFHETVSHHGLSSLLKVT